MGAGKTTALARLAPFLADQGLRVVIITNDQGRHLVDTAALRARHLQTSEVTGGCFCCRFDALLEQCRFRGADAPDVYLAEAVGSCADLAATVAAPLARLHGDRFTVAPLSVLVDSAQAGAMLGLDARRTFSETVRYLWLKQMEEADFLVLNKCETLPVAAIDELRATLRERFPSAALFPVSAQKGDGLEAWFRRVMMDEGRPRPPIALDYDRYAAGEASLAWFDATAELRNAEAFDADRLLLDLAEKICGALQQGAARLAHLKIALASPREDRQSDFALVQATETLPPQVGQRLAGPTRAGELTINLRAETDPGPLPALVWNALAASAPPHLRWEPRFQQCFRPGRPIPTHPRA